MWGAHGGEGASVSRPSKLNPSHAGVALAAEQHQSTLNRSDISIRRSMASPVVGIEPADAEGKHNRGEVNRSADGI